ncbi:hypothetical protein [Sulfuricurvum sp.]|uniref:hypothetical protein n=1 Tax=Sulfuricurvum sp. TaxID=2025608 RepID=UPI00261490CC|nr:hypothetical protein [Sulfuricurvum sp.]MDD3596768.1 hypothetical protein [Sulfuricurvum sp.]
MQNINKIVILLVMLYTIVLADSMQVFENSENLKCNQMRMVKKIQNRDFDPPMNTYFVYKNYLIQPDDRDIENASYIVKKNNTKFNLVTLKNSGTLNYSKALICDDMNEVKYILLIDEFEGGGEDGTYSGEGVLILEISNNNLMKINKKDFFDKKYTPKKLLDEDKTLPLTYTMYKKDGGLYMKVGSTYKSDIITLKKPNSGK